MLRFVALLLGAFLLFAFYYAVRYPSGAIFPTRRAKLLRKVGPIADGVLQDAQIRFVARAGGQARVMLQANYKYLVKDTEFHVVLPTDSNKLNLPSITLADTRKTVSDVEGAREIEIPEYLEFKDGTKLNGTENIRQFFLETLRRERPKVEVLFDSKNPSVSTVRDWS